MAVKRRGCEYDVVVVLDQLTSIGLFAFLSTLNIPQVQSNTSFTHNESLSLIVFVANGCMLLLLPTGRLR